MCGCVGVVAVRAGESAGAPEGGEGGSREGGGGRVVLPL